MYSPRIPSFADRFRRCAALRPDWIAAILLDAEFFDIRIKYELLARDQGDVHESAVTFTSLARNTLNKAVGFQECRPNGWKIVSLAHQFGAKAREIACSLLGHFHHPFDIKQQLLCR